MVKVKLDLVNQGHGYVELELQKARYSNYRLAIQLIHIVSGELWATLTINLPEDELDEGEFFVQAWGENKDTAHALLTQTDLFVDTFRTVPTEFVEADVWKFANPKTLDNMDRYGARRTRKDWSHISEPVKELQNGMAKQMFGMTIDEAHEQEVCIQCKRSADDHIYSLQGYREYHLSALCEICFDKLEAHDA